MRILVLSDSHSGLSFMRYAVQRTKPDAIIHLGDYFDDGEALRETFGHITIHQVGGNCDRHRSYEIRPETLCYALGGVKILMVHGHNQHVKSGLGGLLSLARSSGAQVALYGHTHVVDCHEEDGILVLNPGACGGFSGSVGLLEICDGKVTDCQILRQADLEELQ